VVVIALRVLPLLRGIIFLIPLVGIAFGIYWLIQYSRQRAREKAYSESTEGMIQLKMDRCMREVSRNRKDIFNIQKNIDDLKTRLSKAYDAEPAARKKTETLIHEFQEERELREARIQFLESAMKKLRSLLHNHQLVQALQQKQGQLKLLREKNYEDLADLEEFRSNIEYDHAYLQTIDDLSTRMLNTESLQNVRNLKKQLEEMTKDLENGNGNGTWEWEWEWVSRQVDR
jgi:ABC-type transporter Mla subunit MlaD